MLSRDRDQSQLDKVFRREMKSLGGVHKKLLTIFLVFSCSDAFKVLSVFPNAWQSHWKIGTSVIKQLAAAGHDVTLISPFELKEPNVHNVILTNYLEDKLKNKFELAHLSPFMNFVFLPQLFENIINFTLSHPNVQKIMDEKFDVVIVEVSQSEALLGFGAHFNCPVIGVTIFGTASYSNVMTANPYPSSFVPNLFLKYTDRMTFWQRLHNTITWKLDEFFIYFSHFPRQNKLYEKHFPNVGTSFDEQRKNIALLFNNYHFSSSTVRPGMPNIVDIGGIHIEPAKPLLKDIQEFLDSAEDGAILFSMGSIIQAIHWPVAKREAFVKAFGKLKQKVLWKYENETLPNKPDNVMISSWLPQRDILAHPNIKLFITHGGMLGTTEAVVEGVPALGIPVFSDQKMNMNIAVNKGYAISINYDEITEKTVTGALETIFNDRNISLKAKEISRIYNDRPLTPQKAVVYWTEYVVRHKGARHLQTAAHEMSYIQLHSMDVYAFLLTLLLTILIFLVKLCQFACKRCSRTSQNEPKCKTH